MREDEVLVESDDHSYRVARVMTRKVVYNTETRSFFEYHGDEHLEENETVVEARVAE